MLTKFAEMYVNKYTNVDEICRNVYKQIYKRRRNLEKCKTNIQPLTKFAEMYINKYTNIEEICRNVYKQIYKS